MSPLHSPRTPWVMLCIFCGVALMLLVLTAGRELGLIGKVTTADEVAAVKNEVRMPIPFEKHISDPEPTPTPQPPESLITSESHVTLVEKSPAGAPQAPSETPDQKPPAEGPPSATQGPGKLLSHRFKQSGTSFEAVFRTDRPVAGAKLFFKSGPALWAVDLPGEWTNYTPRVSHIASGPIGRVVIGRHDDFLRVVFRYRDNDQPQPEETPVLTETEDGFEVVIH